MRKVRTEERELTARLLNHSDDDEEEMDENGTHSDSQSYELKSRSRIRNGFNSNAAINPILASLYQQQDHKKPVRKVYTDQANNSNLVDYVEWSIKEGDTLSSLSLKSGCTMSHLKRANNLITDQDFYALSVIKIPVKKYGILSEVLVLENNGLPHNQLPTADLLGLNTAPDPPVNRIPDMSISTDGDDVIREAQKFIQNVDKEVTQIKEKVIDKRTESIVSGLPALVNNEIPHSSNSSTRLPLHAAPFNCDGADGGLTIYHVLILVLIVCILIPVIYIFMAEEHQLEVNSHTLHSH